MVPLARVSNIDLLQGNNDTVSPHGDDSWVLFSLLYCCFHFFFFFFSATILSYSQHKA
jgi:hypothetical protein